MTDEKLEQLKREVALTPQDADAVTRLFTAEKRAGTYLLVDFRREPKNDLTVPDGWKIYQFSDLPIIDSGFKGSSLENAIVSSFDSITYWTERNLFDAGYNELSCSLYNPYIAPGFRTKTILQYESRHLRVRVGLDGAQPSSVDEAKEQGFMFFVDNRDIGKYLKQIVSVVEPDFHQVRREK